ncbi:hypothetical protein ACLB2K_068428 [Fragaria x ananassa]
MNFAATTLPHSPLPSRTFSNSTSNSVGFLRLVLHNDEDDSSMENTAKIGRPPPSQSPLACYVSTGVVMPNQEVENRPTFTTISSSITTETEKPSAPQAKTQTQDEKFDWYAHWYPLMPVCDLDKRAPHAKKVLGIDVVVWWDRNENAWKVFDDACPHRLAPLSEGRIDQWGRLQCVYHGWCFNGSGDCKFIPQAPADGPPVHTSKKACVGAYPSTVQNGIVWFWPSTDPQHKDILADKKPPYIPEIDDPTFTCVMGNRDFPYGYEVLVENLMDPAHVPYAHYGIMPSQPPDGRKLIRLLSQLDDPLKDPCTTTPRKELKPETFRTSPTSIASNAKSDALILIQHNHPSDRQHHRCNCHTPNSVSVDSKYLTPNPRSEREK